MPRVNKNIFKYNDGFKDLYGDPSDIDYRIAKACENENIETLMKWLDPERDGEGNIPEESDRRLFMEACYRFVPIIQAGFQLKTFDRETGEGLTNDEVLELYQKYYDWQTEIKKNTEESPTSPPPLESAPETKDTGSMENSSTDSNLTSTGASQQ